MNPNIASASPTRSLTVAQILGVQAPQVPAPALVPAAVVAPVPVAQQPVGVSPTVRDVLMMSPVATQARPAATVSVQPGDTLSEIAARLGVSFDQLKSWNPELFREGVDAGGLLRRADGGLIYPGDAVHAGAAPSAPPVPPTQPVLPPAPPLAPPASVEELRSRISRPDADARTTGGYWNINPNARYNFGHKFVNDQLWRRSPEGLVVWADNGKAVSWNQVNAMPEAQRQAYFQMAGLQPAPPRDEAAGKLAFRQWVEPAPTPVTPPAAPSRPPGKTGSVSDQGKAQMRKMMRVAEQMAAGKPALGRCYERVWQMIEKAGYGNMPGYEPPQAYWPEARNFAEWLALPGVLEKAGLQKLPIDNPYKAPAGSIVVVRAGAPGTAHPTAGDIAIAMGNGRFLNDGEMGYGGSGSFKPGNNYVLGVYIPV